MNLMLPLILLATFLQSCAHFLPAPQRKQPVVRVFHQGRVDHVPLERYVASVLAGEVHQSWPLEALKAQAIASRTYAKKRMNERRNANFDVQSTVMDQVYTGKSLDIFIRAARETQGLVLVSNQDLAETSFHSTCGGQTASAKSVWGRSYPHLNGVSCGFCQSSPTFNWSKDITLKELEQKFGFVPQSIRIKSRFADGRAEMIELSGIKRLLISGHEFRMMLGPMKVKSTLITDINIKGSTITVSGQGFGHGVGLCQYGAKGLATNGKDHRRILAHYYPNTVIRKIY